MCTQVDYYDPVWQIVYILQDPDLQCDFMTKPDVWGQRGGRAYGEMNTGGWWFGTHSEAPEVELVLYDPEYDPKYNILVAIN